MPPSPAWQLDQIANACEALLWLVVSLVLVVRASVRRDGYRPLGWFAAAVFGLFALTDVVEIYSRAWYRPWWLLLAKVLCVLGIGAAWVAYRRQRQRPGGPAEREHESPASAGK